MKKMRDTHPNVFESIDEEEAQLMAETNQYVRVSKKESERIKVKFKEAAKLENKGFELLLVDDGDAAIKAFQQSEKNFPTVQQKKQALSDFINENIEVLRSSDTDAKKRIFSKILKEYSIKMAPALKKKFERKIKD